VFDAREKAFAFFRGTCWRGVYDNMRTAVDAVFIGKERQFNRRSPQMCGHYPFEPTACPPAAGQVKGQVENEVSLARERFFTPRLKFKSFDEMNAWLTDKCVAHARAHPRPEDKSRTIWEAFEAERPFLVEHRGPFDGFHATPASVSKTCLVRFDGDKYLVSARAVGRPVEVQAYADRIVIKQDGEIVGGRRVPKEPFRASRRSGSAIGKIGRMRSSVSPAPGRSLSPGPFLQVYCAPRRTLNSIYGGLQSAMIACILRLERWNGGQTGDDCIAVWPFGSPPVRRRGHVERRFRRGAARRPCERRDHRHRNAHSAQGLDGCKPGCELRPQRT
jgi:hypothetical protein